ncbi:MAG: T9SS type A sorting domain-containing protein, partial [Calditrichaeota bacterium]|nr:T9SS type A sorting domain-containing protein [Calditrichota bacterium]
ADTLKNFSLNLMAGETYVAIANGVLDPSAFEANPDGRSTAFTLFINAMAREIADSTNVDFFVVHGASDAPTVDVIARDVATLVDDAAYGDMTGYISVPPASYTLDITPGNDNNTIVASFNADLSGLAGQSATVLASGFLSPGNDQNGQSFGLIAVLASGDVVSLNPVTGLEQFGEAIPVKFDLKQNYPNPFNPETQIEFSIPANQKVALKVYDISGREVAELLNESLAAGAYSVPFNATNLSSGIYFYRLQTDNFVETKRMTLLK